MSRGESIGDVFVKGRIRSSRKWFLDWSLSGIFSTVRATAPHPKLRTHLIVLPCSVLLVMHVILMGIVSATVAGCVPTRRFLKYLRLTQH